MTSWYILHERSFLRNIFTTADLPSPSEYARAYLVVCSCFWMHDSLSDSCRQTSIVAMQIAHVWSRLRRQSSLVLVSPFSIRHPIMRQAIDWINLLSYHHARVLAARVHATTSPYFAVISHACGAFCKIFFYLSLASSRWAIFTASTS